MSDDNIVMRSERQTVCPVGLIKKHRFLWGLRGATKRGRYRIGAKLHFCLCLNRLPLIDEVPYLPHQGLVTVDKGLRGFVVLVEPGGGHPGLQRLDLSL